MEDDIYEFSQIDNFNSRLFSFYSVGKTIIKKVVSFQEVSEHDMVDNLVLADELNGEINAETNSNNGDIYKVLGTVSAIIDYYLNLQPNRSIYIKGADVRRIRVYQNRIVKFLNKEENKYIILAQKIRNGVFEMFTDEEDYVGFLIFRGE